MNRYLYFVVFIFILYSCVKDKPKGSPDTSPSKDTRKVYIANEGNFGSGNSSLSIIDLKENTIHNNVFQNQNNLELGDVFQSILPVEDKLLLAINNSDKITVINKKDFQLESSIAIHKPRYMLLAEEGKLYVTSIYKPEINIVDLKTYKVSHKIVTDYPNTEGILMHGDYVYACNWDTACNYIYEIDPKSDTIVRRIFISGYAPHSILVDKNNTLWVVAGNIYKKKKATLTQIDLNSGTIIKSFSFQSNTDIIKPVWNPTKDTLYFLSVDYNGTSQQNGVYRMSVSDHTLPDQLFIPSQPLQYFWGLGIDSATNTIYVADPKGFIQQGTIYTYSPNGALLNKYECGIGPGFFYFE